MYPVHLFLPAGTVVDNEEVRQLTHVVIIGLRLVWFSQSAQGGERGWVVKAKAINLNARSKVRFKVATSRTYERACLTIGLMDL